MNRRPIEPDNLYQFQWISSPAVHPDGRIAYMHQAINKEKDDYLTHLRLLDPDGNGDRRLSSGDKDTAPAWSPDGELLAFLRTAEGGKQLWTLPAAGGEEKVRTDVKRGVGSFIWSPDSRYIAFTSRVSLDEEREALTLQEYALLSGRAGRGYERTAPKAEGSGWWDGLYSHLFVLELSTGEVTALSEGPYNMSAPEWSPDSAELFFVSKRIEDAEADPDLTEFNDVFTVSRSGGPWRRITDSTLAITDCIGSPDGSVLYLLASDRKYGSGSHNRLYKVQAAGGAPQLLAPEADFQLGNYVLSDMKNGVPSRTLQSASRDGDEGVYLPVTQHGSVQIYRFTKEGTYCALTPEDGRDIYHYAPSPDGRYLVYAALTAERPGELYRLELASGAEERLTRHNDDVMAGLQVSLPEAFTYTSADGLTIQAWIIKPAGLKQGEKAPLILQIHGGPHAMCSGNYSHEMQTLAAQGYALLLPNPRGSFGYGQAFAKACRGDFGGWDFQDLMDGVDEALRRFDYIDGSRLGVAGGSYGGLMTNWIIGQSNRFRAAVSQRCISNWLSFYGLSDIGISYTEGIVGSSPAANAGLLWSKSPVAHAVRVETPLLLMHGEQDYRCPVGQAEELYTSLKRLGKPVRLIRYPGSNHSLLKSGKPSLRVDSFEQVRAWFGHYFNQGENKV